MSSFLVQVASRGTRECCGGHEQSLENSSESTGLQMGKWDVNLVSKDSREKKRGSSGRADER